MKHLFFLIFVVSVFFCFKFCLLVLGYVLGVKIEVRVLWEVTLSKTFFLIACFVEGAPLHP